MIYKEKLEDSATRNYCYISNCLCEPCVHPP